MHLPAHVHDGVPAPPVFRAWFERMAHPGRGPGAAHVRARPSPLTQTVMQDSCLLSEESSPLGHLWPKVLIHCYSCQSYAGV